MLDWSNVTSKYKGNERVRKTSKDDLSTSWFAIWGHNVDTTCGLPMTVPRKRSSDEGKSRRFETASSAGKLPQKNIEELNDRRLTEDLCSGQQKEWIDSWLHYLQLMLPSVAGSSGFSDSTFGSRWSAQASAAPSSPWNHWNFTLRWLEFTLW